MTWLQLHIRRHRDDLHEWSVGLHGYLSAQGVEETADACLRSSTAVMEGEGHLETFYDGRLIGSFSVAEIDADSSRIARMFAP